VLQKRTGRRPRPAVRAAISAHLSAIPLLAWPGGRLWALALVAGSHALLAAFGLWPRSQVLGSTLVRLPPGERDGQVALTFDDGPDPEVTPALLDVLDRGGARASFFLIGERARAHPALVREIIRRGHAVENHTQRHAPWFALFGPRRLWREVAGAQAVLTALAGRAPRFVRAPAGLRSPLLDPVLAELDLLHASWSRRGYDTRCRDPSRVLRRLLRGLRPGDVLLLHDGNAARTAGNVPVVLEVVPALLTALAERGLRAVPISPAAMPGRAAAAGSPASGARASR
jgi:peptidoglycan/xylan/chitin deacetylase (PgdA/CDA1 family)